MRFYLLDKLICPRCAHFPLSVEIMEERQGPLSIANVQPCELYCAHNATWLGHVQPPCFSCLKRRIWLGAIVCTECGASYPIEEGIPNLVVDEALDKWVAEEEAWWSEFYARTAGWIDTMQTGTVAVEVPGNRFYERNKYLFAPLRQRGIKGKVVLEIGAGTSKDVAYLLPPSVGGYFYIATDISKKALTIGAQLLPEGDFIQCDAGRIPFRKETSDVLIILGVLHHIPHWQKSLIRIIELLKPGGWMLFDEAIEKPRVLGRFRKHSLTASIDSPHEGEIVLGELLEILSQKGDVITWQKMTPLRVLLVWVLGSVVENSLIVTKAVLTIDQLFMRSLGKIFKSLGGGEVIGIFEKR